MSREPGPLHAVVLAGGAGERFWSASRVHHPKPLLRVAGPGARTSLLAATLERAAAFAGPGDTWLVCGREHAAAMRREVRREMRREVRREVRREMRREVRREMRRESGLSPGRVLVEPVRRNTAMAVGVAAARIAHRHPDAVMAVLPADHRIPDRAAFARAIRRAARAAREESALVTLGVEPTRPETGYGYIRLGALGPAPLHRVLRFVEKPSRARARRFYESGHYRWNAGIFVWRARVILEEIEEHAPELHRALAPLRKPPRGASRAWWSAAMERAYRRAPSLPIDVAVLERSRRVWCLPVTFRWSDVGTWGSLAETLGVAPGVTRVIEGDAVLCDAGGNLVWGGDRPIALLGVSGLAVVDAGDALLVASLERSGELREVVRKLRRRGRDDLV